MKIQNLAIIFLIIAIPIIMVLAYYMRLEEATIRKQIEYDTNLLSATQDALNSLETNWFDLSVYSNSDTTENTFVSASINVFLTGIANNLNIAGTAKEYVSNYVPAISYLMYDGYYTYSKELVPVALENDKGMQLYYDTVQDVIVDEREENICFPVYVPENEADGIPKPYTYRGVDGEKETKMVVGVTDATKAKKEYKPTLSNKKKYTARYTQNSNKTDVVIEYTLDNKIGIYGKINDQAVKAEGYLAWFNSNSQMPVLKDIGEPVSSGVKYNGIEIGAENLSEQITYMHYGEIYIGTYPYFYDVKHNKIYYDSERDEYFTKENERINYIQNNDVIKVGDEGCYYRSVSVLWGNDDTTTQYRKLYQVINGADKGKWYTNVEPNKYTLSETPTAERTEISENDITSLGIPIDQCLDYSAISYYVEAKAFTNFVKQNLLDVKEINYNEATKTYESNTIDNIFDISENNNPEKDDSLIVQYKRKIMRDRIENDLNYAIYNFGRGKSNLSIPKIKEDDWDKAFNNVSIIAFLQGVPIGAKEYNNYFVVTSRTNTSYVDPDSFYFSGEEEYFHRMYCERAKNIKYTAYRSIEYDVRTTQSSEGNTYYYQHDTYNKENPTDDINAEKACYYCIINRVKFNKTTNSFIIDSQTKAYYEALARERYAQIVRLVKTTEIYENDGEDEEEEEEEVEEEEVEIDDTGS